MTNIKMENLVVEQMQLQGRHLIEASAGTGKTYNISHIYLRLLLEKKLNVQQILVMTFAKAATEELRGRIDKVLRNAIANWDQLMVEDDFYKHLGKHYNAQQVKKILKPALLELDEAAIFTLHGFCARALKTQAFASAMPFEITLEADSSDILKQAVRDWIRAINQDPIAFELLYQAGWHSPEQFYQQFERALKNSYPISILDEKEITLQSDAVKKGLVEQFNLQKKQVKQQLLLNQEKINIENINADPNVHKRLIEWEHLLDWLDNEDDSPCPKQAASFISGARGVYKKNPQTADIVLPFKNLRADFTKQFSRHHELLQKKLSQIPLNHLVTLGIRQIREQFLLAKQRVAIMDYNDLITYLSQRLVPEQLPDQEPEQGEILANALRQQYPYALVDEFQDTDPQQYAIVDRLYPKGAENQALFMIGDPKQAIYSFRGGDIFTYLQAKDNADYYWSMDTNWRSLASVVDGYNRLFWGNDLHQDSYDVFSYGINYQQIKSTEKAQAAGTDLADPDTQFSAINYCYLSEIAGIEKPTADLWRSHLANWCVSEIDRLLHHVKMSHVKMGSHAIREQDIAILVRTGTEAKLIRQKLASQNYDSVYLSAKESIYESAQARELLVVLRGILDCEESTLLVAALSTDLMGGSCQKLLDYQNPQMSELWESQRNKAVELRNLWLVQGFMPMLIRLIKLDYQPQAHEHERALTNMLQLAELLQYASTKYKQQRQLMKWFSEQLDQLNGEEEAQLRLESDANLIRIITIHGSKGLEYPIVFIPFASNYGDPTKPGNKSMNLFKFHDAKSRQIKQQIGASDQALQLVKAEGYAESIRLLYVAMTRASHRCYLGIAPISGKSHLSALGLSLHLKDESEWLLSLSQLAQAASKSSAFIDLNSMTIKDRQSEKIIDQPLLQAAIFTHKTIKENWSIGSFSSLIRSAGSFLSHDVIPDRDDASEANGLASTPLKDSNVKENNVNDSNVNDNKAKESSTSLALRFGLKKGADSGNLLHDILEVTDFSTTELLDTLQKPLRNFPDKGIDQNELEQWLLDCLATPIPVISDTQRSFKLSDLNWINTLREAEFYFPITDVLVNNLENCLNHHRGYCLPLPRRSLPIREKLNGMMRGFIDLIFEYEGKYYIADYKSTYLGDSLEDYHFDALKSNNQRHNYDLQYLIYAVALHRYLQQRIDNYVLDEHFGGVYYLYLRGMSSESLSYNGVYYTAIDSSFLQQLDVLFKGESVHFSQRRSVDDI